MLRVSNMAEAVRFDITAIRLINTHQYVCKHFIYHHTYHQNIKVPTKLQVIYKDLINGYKWRYYITGLGLVRFYFHINPQALIRWR